MEVIELCHGSFIQDIHLEELSLKVCLPIEGMRTVTKREVISHPYVKDEMPNVIVTELQSWKRNHRPLHRASRRHNKCRIDELAKPKVNHQLIIDRPSIYWADKLQPNTTLSVTFPIVTPRLEELSRPKRFYSTYYNESRSTPIWPISRASLEAKASPRLKVLAYPKLRSNFWIVDPSEVQVSKAAQLAQPGPRTLELATPRNKSLSFSEIYLTEKAKQRYPNFNRIYTLAMPKVLDANYTYNKPCSWEISEGTKNAMASKRTLSLAKPKERKDFNEGHNPYCVSEAALRAEPSPRIYELATPKRVVRKV